MPNSRTALGLECHAYSPCLYSSHAENVSLSGGGVIDGQGQRWWRRYFDLHQEKSIPNDREILFGELNEDAGLRVGDSPYTEWRLQHLRPALVQFFNCRRVRLEGLLLQNSPFWNTHIVYCDNVMSAVTSKCTTFGHFKVHHSGRG